MSRGYALAALAVVGCAARPLPLPGGDAGVDLLAACEAVRDCRLIPGVTGCPQPWPPPTLGNYPVDQAALGCLSGVRGDCAAARRCLGSGAEPPTCRTSSCDGDVLKVCIDGVRSDARPGIVRFRCADVGQRCLASATGADCGTSLCDTPGRFCENGVAVECSNGVEKRFECASVGLACRGAVCAP
ncbi:MAG TPA: hypothetical protein VMZ28_03200 [Kofleriaceae bacterium]|nr:hypothetical protein [Kofleriaceae bacterium]